MESPKLKPISSTSRTPEASKQPKLSPSTARAKPQLRSTESPSVGNGTEEAAELLEKYGCGPIQFAGSSNASYERHLIFDNAIALGAAGPRERFEAFARSVRDVLSQRWVNTEETYAQKNPKR